MTRAALLALALGPRTLCNPHIPPGPAAAELARAPSPMSIAAAPDAAEVRFTATLAFGSAADAPGAEGLAALTVRGMALAGAGSLDAAGFSAAVDAAGGAWSIDVDRDASTLALTCPAATADACAALLADAITAPRFEEAAVDALVVRSLDELAALRADPQRLGEEALAGWLFEAHPYGHPPVGRAGVLPVRTAAELRRTHAARVVREAVAVEAAGAVGPGAEAALRAGLDALPGLPAPEVVLQRPLPATGRAILVVGAAGPVRWRLGHSLPPGADATDRAAWLVADAIVEANARTRAGAPVGPWAPPPSRRLAHLDLDLGPAPADDPVAAVEALGLALADLSRLAADVPDPAEWEPARAAVLAALTRHGDEALAAAARALTPAIAGAVWARDLRPADLRAVATTADPDALLAALAALAASGEDPAALGVEPGAVHRVAAKELFR